MATGGVLRWSPNSQQRESSVRGCRRSSLRSFLETGLTTSSMYYLAWSSSGHKNTQIKGLEFMLSFRRYLGCSSRFKTFSMRLIFACWILTSSSSVRSPLKGFDLCPVSSHPIKPLSSLASNPFKGWSGLTLLHDDPLPATWERRNSSHQHVAEKRFRLENERDFRSSMYKKYQRGANVADEMDNALLVTTVGLAASGVGLLSTITAAPVALGLQAGAIVCGMLGAGGKLIGRRLQAKPRKHDLIRGLAESKLNIIADRFRPCWLTTKLPKRNFVWSSLWLTSTTRWRPRSVGIRSKAVACQKMKKNQAISACERRSYDDSPRQVIWRDPSWNQQWHLSISCWLA